MIFEFRLTDHAKARRKQMKVTEHEIERALTDPDMVYPGRSGATCYQRGRIVVVTDADVVVTVLWHGREGRDG